MKCALNADEQALGLECVRAAFSERLLPVDKTAAKRTEPLSSVLHERVIARSIRQPSGCLEWQGAVGASGHGRIRFNGNLYLPHRVALEALLGPLPRRVLACHHCDNPRCVEQTHLFPGTYRDNVIDALEKGRATHPPHDAKNSAAVAESNRKRRARNYRGESREMSPERGAQPVAKPRKRDRSNPDRKREKSP